MVDSLVGEETMDMEVTDVETTDVTTTGG